MTVDLNALEAVLAKTTPGEWKYSQREDYFDINGLLLGHMRYPLGDKSDDLCAIVALHNAAPTLIAEHRAALARVEELEKRLSSHADWLQGAAAGDFEDAAADGGVTVGMVVQQEMREQLRRIQAALEPKP